MTYKPMPSDKSGTFTPPTLPPLTVIEKKAPSYPNLGERIIRSTLHVVATLVLLMVGIMLVLGLSVVARIGQGLDNLAPGPSSTGCPFGEGQCGG